MTETTKREVHKEKTKREKERILTSLSKEEDERDE